MSPSQGLQLQKGGGDAGITTLPAAVRWEPALSPSSAGGNLHRSIIRQQLVFKALKVLNFIGKT